MYALSRAGTGRWASAPRGRRRHVIDHFSDQALKDYLRKFDEAFAGHNIRSLRAFFKDSYEVDDAEGESNWRPTSSKSFGRGAATTRDNCRRWPERFLDRGDASLYDFRETISDLLLDAFTDTWRQWAEGKRRHHRNQAHGSPANILDLYAARTFPRPKGPTSCG